MKVAVIFTAIEGVGTPHLAAFRAHNPDVPYFVATKPAAKHFVDHMDNTIVECWAENRDGLDVDYVIHADYDTRIACDVMRALAVSDDRLVDVIVNTWTLNGRGITLNLVAFKRSMLDLMVDKYAAFNPDMYCEARVFAFCQAHGLNGQMMPDDVCSEMHFNRRNAEPWERRFAHPIKHSIDNLAEDNIRVTLLTFCSRPKLLPCVAASVTSAQVPDGVDLRWLVKMNRPERMQYCDHLRIWDATLRSLSKTWVLILSDDNLLHSDFVSGLASHVKANPAVKLIHFRQEYRENSFRAAALENLVGGRADGGQIAFDADYYNSFCWSYDGFAGGEGNLFRRMHDADPTVCSFVDKTLTYHDRIRWL